MRREIINNIRNLVVRSSWYNMVRNGGTFRLIMTRGNIRNVNYTIRELVESFNEQANGREHYLGFEDMCDEVSFNGFLNISDRRETRSFGEMIDRLESYVSLFERIRNINFSMDRNTLRTILPEETEVLQGMSREEVSSLIDRYECGDTLDEEVFRISRQLAFLSLYYENWIRENGLMVVRNLLSRTIGSGVRQAAGISVTESKNFWMSFLEGSFVNRVRGLVTYYGRGGDERTYRITPNSGILYTALAEEGYVNNMIERMDMERVMRPSLDEIVQVCRVGIDCVRTALSYEYNLGICSVVPGDYYDFDNGEVIRIMPSGRRGRCLMHRDE